MNAMSALAPDARLPGVRQPQLPRSTASSIGFFLQRPPSQMLSPVQSASLSQPVPQLSPSHSYAGHVVAVPSAHVPAPSQH
jgi:hypothetical protein